MTRHCHKHVSQICDAPPWCPIAISNAMYIGNGDDAVLSQACWSISRPGTFVKMMLWPIAGTWCHPCMLGSCRFNRHWLPRCMGVVVSRHRNWLQGMTWFIVKTLKTLASYYFISVKIFSFPPWFWPSEYIMIAVNSLFGWLLVPCFSWVSGYFPGDSLVTHRSFWHGGLFPSYQAE
jgi:hypothetical protein